MEQITSRLYQIGLGAVNVFLVEDDGLTLIDTGLPGSADKLLAAIRKGGKNPADIKRIVLTHWHPDHAGNAAELQQRLGARLYAHTAEAAIIEQGGGTERPRHLTPGLVNQLIFSLFIKKVSSRIAPARVDERMADGDVIPLAGGLQVVHTPGHSAGHMALLLREEGVLVAGDICAHVAGLAYSTVYEDIAVGRQSILKAAGLPFDQAVFGHGGPLRSRANEKLNAKFRRPLPTSAAPLKAV